jgi:hypothetical protein
MEQQAMRINNVGPLIVTPVEPRIEVGNARAVDAIRAYTPGEAQAREAVMPVPEREEAVPEPVAEGERRRQRNDRRGEDRRKRQVPVLIDTRVGDRRSSARRDEDAGPTHIDVEI